MLQHICDLMHPCDLDLRVHVSVNSARWLPSVGEGVVYCTNRGDLHICKPGSVHRVPKARAYFSVLMPLAVFVFAEYSSIFVNFIYEKLLLRHRWESKTVPVTDGSDDRQSSYTRQLVMQLLSINSPRTNNTSTQTTSTQGVRRTASTQTDQVAITSGSDSE